MKINYKPVKYSATKTDICPICKKRATRSKTFSQTVNPFNTVWDFFHKRNRPKTEAEILRELAIQANKWYAKRTYHQKCEP